MSRLIVSPVGHSIFRPRTEPDGGRAPSIRTSKDVEAQLRREPEALRGASVELLTLDRLGVTPEDHAAFVATDNDESEAAARMNARVAERVFGVKATCARIRGLEMRDSGRFRREGIPALARTLDELMSGAETEGRKVFLGVTTGIKPVLPYVSVYGMLRGATTVYLFEESHDLLRLPPLPIDFDWDGLETVRSVLREVDEQTAIPRAQLDARLGLDAARFEGLFEDVDGEATLSAFGLMLLADVKAAEDNPVLLSPAAQRTLEGLDGVQRQIIDRMLDRIRNPLTRAQRIHTFHTTDLQVFKLPRTTKRLAYFVENRVVYVAEIYVDHNRYEIDLPERARSQYRIKEFNAYFPPRASRLLTDESSPEQEIDAAAERAVAEERGARLEAEKQAASSAGDAAAAMQLAEEKEAAARSFAEKARALEEQLAETKSTVDKLCSASLFERLTWAIRGGPAGSRSA